MPIFIQYEHLLIFLKMVTNAQVMCKNGSKYSWMAILTIFDNFDHKNSTVDQEGQRP